MYDVAAALVHPLRAMTQNFLELAKKGDPRVLAGLINRALQTKGIAVKATQQGDITHFLFECSQDIPEPTALTDYLLQALTRLKAPPLALLLSVRAEGQREVAWQRRLSFDPNAAHSPATPPPPRPPAPANGSGGTVGSAAVASLGALNGQGVGQTPVQSPVEASRASGADGDLEPEAAHPDLESEDTTQLWDDEEGSDEADAGDEATDGEALDLWSEEEALEAAEEADETGFEPALDDSPAEDNTADSVESESQSTSPAFFPFVAAAVLASLFAVAGVAYRFFYYPSQQATTDQTEVTTTAPDSTGDGAMTGTDTATPDPDAGAADAGATGTGTDAAGTTAEDAATGTDGTGSPDATADNAGDGGLGDANLGDVNIEDATLGDLGGGDVPMPEVGDFDPTALVPIEEVANPWYEGVSLAMDAAVLTQTATTAEEWTMIAARWERAIDLMAAVPATDANYAQAQERVATYQENLDYAIQNASY